VILRLASHWPRVTTLVVQLGARDLAEGDERPPTLSLWSMVNFTFFTVVVLDTVTKPIDFGFKRSRVRVRVTTQKESAPICISTEQCIISYRS